MRGKLYLGTQGFAFDDWVGPFYPQGTPKSSYLEAYARHFNCVEIDSTFYGIPRRETVEGWRRRTPEGFQFVAKFPRSITHDKKLDRSLGEAEVFVGGMQALGDKLAVLILQFAYDFAPDQFDRLQAFLGALPGSTRYAVEVRNRGWLTPEFAQMLTEHNVALVLQDLHYMPKLDWITADFALIRWLGRRKDISQFDRIQIDRTEELRSWADRVVRFLDDGLDVYGFFNNHYAGHSPASARQFASMLGAEPNLPQDEAGPDKQMSLDLPQE